MCRVSLAACHESENRFGALIRARRFYTVISTGKAVPRYLKYRLGKIA